MDTKQIEEERKLELRDKQKWLNYNAISVALYAISAIVFIAGVILFAIEFQKDWWEAGRYVWVGTALGGALRSLADVADRLAKRYKMTHPHYPLFIEADKNGDGMISPQEFAEFMDRRIKR